MMKIEKMGISMTEAKELESCQRLPSMLIGNKVNTRLPCLIILPRNAVVKLHPRVEAVVDSVSEKA